MYAHVVEGTLGEDPPDGIKAKGVIHWVSATAGLDAEIRCYDRLFNDPDPGKSEDMMAVLNPSSLVRLETLLLNPHLPQPLRKRFTSLSGRVILLLIAMIMLGKSRFLI